MATARTITSGIMRLQNRYPNYIKRPEDFEFIVKTWSNEFKTVDDGDFLRAVDLIINSSSFFPQAHEVRDKLKRVEFIKKQKIATYEGRLETYLRYKDAAQPQIDLWVDVKRLVDDSKGWTTKDFKAEVEFFKEQVNKAIEELPEDYIRENGVTKL